MRSRLTPSPATAIALLALFISVGGGAAYAAAHLLNGSQIKKNSIPANRIVKHSLTGTQINVSSLPTVPTASHATTADHATSATTASNASTLGGQAPSAFVPASRLQITGNVAVPADGQTHQIFARPPLTWTATCTNNGGGSYTLRAFATSSETANFTELGNTGSSVPMTGPGLQIWEVGGTGANYVATAYSVVGVDGTQYQGTFAAGIHVAGTACNFSVVAAG